KQLGRDVGADVRHARGALVLGVGDETTLGNVAVFDIDAVGSRARDKNVFDYFFAAFHFRRRAASACADFADQRGAFFQILVVLERQVFIAALRCGDRVG